MKYNALRNSLIKSMIADVSNGLTVLLKPLYSFSTLLMIIGSSYYAIIHILCGNFFDFVIRGAFIGIISAIFIFYKKNYLNLNEAVTANIIVFTIKMCVIMLVRTLIPCANSIEMILIEMTLILIPTILSCFTVYRKLAPVFVTVILIIFCICSIVLDSRILKVSIPVFVLIVYSVQIVMLYTLKMNYKIKRKNIKLTNEQRSFIDFFNLNHEQWKQIKEGRLDREQAKFILSRFDNDIQDKIIHRLKDIIQSEEEIKDILSQNHSDFTSGEKNLCCYILQGKSVTEIAKLKEITNSGVTIMRSRIRKKIGLTQHESLKDYLESLVRGHLGDT